MSLLASHLTAWAAGVIFCLLLAAIGKHDTGAEMVFFGTMIAFSLFAYYRASSL